MGGFISLQIKKIEKKNDRDKVFKSVIGGFLVFLDPVWRGVTVLKQLFFRR